MAGCLGAWGLRVSGMWDVYLRACVCGFAAVRSDDLDPKP